MRTPLLTVLLSFIFTCLCFSQACAEHKRNILILNSYHQGFKWTDDVVRGVLDGLGTKRVDYQIFIEFMGTKLVHSKEYFAALRSLYAVKYRDTRFALIIASDDDALNFLKLFRDDTFGKTPVVFCGANWFKTEGLYGHELYTGVNENVDIAKTIDLMLRLHPRIKRIYAVADGTTTGLIVRRKLHDLRPRYSKRVDLLIPEDLELHEILQQVATLGDGDLILLTIFSRDKNGEFIEYNDISMALARKSKVAIYGLWDFHLGFGIVGGMLTSGQAQGENVGRLALRILQGESVNTIPVLMESPNRYLFDFEQLKRFGIPRNDLPKDSVIINEPASLYTVNKGLIWGLLAGITTLCIAILVLLGNIHRRSIAEAALRSSEEKYHTLIDNLTLGICRISGGPTGPFLQVNPAMAAMFGYESMTELMDRTISQLYLHPEDREKAIEEMQHSGQLRSKEISMRKRDGSPIWVSVNAKAHYDPAGHLDWIDGIIEDITEQKRLEQQLRQTQKMEALGTLTGGIAHDFNNILTAIIGYANLLQMRIGEDTLMKTYTGEILTASQRAANLTKSLLAFSRKQEIVTRPININDQIKAFESFIARIIGEDVELQIATCPDDLVVMADSTQLEQVLMNLATNARDAMANGGMLSIATRPVTFDIHDMTVHSSLKPGRHAEISISDTGCGMDETTRLRIFEPFFTSKEKGRGTGLGLSILYGIISQHGGEITVYSDLGKGTTFKIYLPTVAAEVEHLEVPKELAPRGGTETILLTEDDPALRKLEKGVLEQFGYRVIEAENGEEALARYRENPEAVDCLILDVIMPRKNGKEVYDEIRALQPTMKALFTSGYTADIIHRQGILHKDLHFLSKPATPSELLRRLREILDANQEK